MLSFTNRDAVEVQLRIRAVSGTAGFQRVDCFALDSNGNCLLTVHGGGNNVSDAAAISIEPRVAAGDVMLKARLARIRDDATTVALVVQRAGTNAGAAPPLHVELQWLNSTSSPSAISVECADGSAAPCCVAAFHRADANSQWTLRRLSNVVLAECGGGGNSPLSAAAATAAERLRPIVEALENPGQGAPSNSMMTMTSNRPVAAGASAPSALEGIDEDDDTGSGVAGAPPRHIALQPGSTVVVGTGWDDIKGQEADLDLSCLVLNSRGAISERVFWGQLSVCDGAITHSGDNDDGLGAGDDERIWVQTASPSLAHAVAVVFLLSKYSAAEIQPRHNIHVRVVESGRAHIERAGMHAFFPRERHATRSVAFAALVRRPNRPVSGPGECLGAPWQLVEMAESVDVESALDPSWAQHAARLLGAALNPTAPIPRAPTQQQQQQQQTQQQPPAAGKTVPLVDDASNSSSSMRQRGASAAQPAVAAAAAPAAVRQPAAGLAPPPPPPANAQQTAAENLKVVLIAMALAFLLWLWMAL